MGKKQVLPNGGVLALKVTCALLMMLACIWFFTTHIQLFWDDLRAFNPFPIVFFVGIILIWIYLGFLIGRADDKKFYLADRFDIWYRIIFSTVLIAIGVRSFFAYPYLNVPISIIIICIISGLVTWLTPRIVDNNNSEF